MYKDTNKRSIVKGISWRFFATSTTIIIVYVFFGRLDLAVAAGLLETVAKIALYWAHERAWVRIKWGRKRIEPFSLWFTGLPLSGKTTIADAVFEELKKLDIPLERIDSRDIRELVPNIGYTRADRNRHMYRIGHLIKTLQNNSVSTISSFVSPYRESRKAIREMVKNNIVVYVKADIETCKLRDYKGVYIKALNGELKNFSGINDIYEEPQYAEIVIDTEKTSIEEATIEIVKYIKKKMLNNENIVWHNSYVCKAERARIKFQKPCILWFTGLSGSGKSTLANALELKLYKLGFHTYLLDGDNVRCGLNSDLGFDEKSRIENIRRIGEVSKLFVSSGTIVLTAFISPFINDREQVRCLVEDKEFVEIFVDTPIEVCQSRDPKGLYKKARDGKIKNFTGLDSPYEKPLSPEIHIINDNKSNVDKNIDTILEYLKQNEYI